MIELSFPHMISAWILNNIDTRWKKFVYHVDENQSDWFVICVFFFFNWKTVTIFASVDTYALMI